MGEHKGRRTEPGAPRLGALDVDAYLNDPSRKQTFVTPMFDVIAPRYDEFTRIFSFGMDASWKREALAAVIAAHAAAPAATGDARAALDLACGTGDFVRALSASLPGFLVTGVDASPRMIAIAEERLIKSGLVVAGRGASADPHMRVRVGDMMALEVDSESVDIVTAGYGVRNVPDPVVAVREMARVLRKGGTLVTLDFYRPEQRAWRALLLGYLTVAGNIFGWWWHRDPVVYGYIAKSIAHFMSWQSFSTLLEREGFVVHRVIRHLGGGIAIHVATRR